MDVQSLNKLFKTLIISGKIFEEMNYGIYFNIKILEQKVVVYLACFVGFAIGLLISLFFNKNKTKDEKHRAINEIRKEKFIVNTDYKIIEKEKNNTEQVKQERNESPSLIENTEVVRDIKKEIGANFDSKNISNKYKKKEEKIKEIEKEVKKEVKKEENNEWTVVKKGNNKPKI